MSKTDYSNPHAMQLFSSVKKKIDDCGDAAAMRHKALNYILTVVMI